MGVLTQAGPSSTVRRAILAADRAADRAGFAARDPVSVVRERLGAADAEAAALLVAAIALGRAAAIRVKAREMLDRLTGPGGALALDDRADVRRRLAGFRHRFYDADAIGALALGIGRARRGSAGLETLFRERLAAAGGSPPAAWRGACTAFVRAVDPDVGVLPDPSLGSASKRLHLFLRWVVRPDDGVDLGLWSLPTSMLLVPLDVHVHRIARDLGLTAHASPSWAAAEEVTAALRGIDPRDPTRFDLALAHIGITRGCSSGRCTLGAACTLWSACRRGRPSAPAAHRPRSGSRP